MEIIEGGQIEQSTSAYGYSTWTTEHIDSVVTKLLNSNGTHAPKKVYLSSCDDDYMRMMQYACFLEAHGKYTVCSRWPYRNALVNSLTQEQVAHENLVDLNACDIFIVFTDSKFQTSLGNKYVELGMMLQYNEMYLAGIHTPVQLYLVGERTNEYTHLITEQYASFELLLEKLES